MCCKLIGVQELNKPQDQWCQHCQIGVGCKIFEQPERPEPCAGFRCMWLDGLGDDALKPDRSKAVFFSYAERVVHLAVDIGKDWKQHKGIVDIIKRMTESGVYIIVVQGTKRTFLSGKGPMPETFKKAMTPINELHRE